MTPPKTIETRCPTCGHLMRVKNGAALREIRQLANYTQREFGRLVNVSSPYISDIERNRRTCPQEIYDAYMDLSPWGRKG